MAGRGGRLAVAVEVAPKRAFAVAVAWPGWARGGRDEEAALAALVAAGPRYARVVAAAGLAFEPPAGASHLEVVERLPGGSGTEFGVPSVPLADDADPVNAAELERLSAILRAAWDALDAAAARHAGDELAKGPRGGGRDLPKIVDHVDEADRAYVVQLGSRVPGGAARATTAEVRALALATLRARALGERLPDPSGTRVPWTPRRYVRRAAWHALDHAWEIEDRATARR